MHQCARCEWTYPDQVLLSPVVGSIVDGAVCGICAREMRAAIHGADIPFREGTMAWDAEQDAREYRKANPRKAPKESA